MPFYEYRCDACGHELEELQKISDPALKKCPACKKSRLKKLVSAAAFKLTGTGWYETDFKNSDKPAKDAKADAGKDSGATEKTESKAETKTAEKKSSDSKKDVKTKKKESKTSKSKPDTK